MPLHTIYWQQQDPITVDSWEFQFQRIGSNQWEWVFRVEPVDGCINCFQAVVELPRTALLVRSRSISNEIPSVWSNQLPVYLPEPSFGLSIIIAVALLLSVHPLKRVYRQQKRLSTQGESN